MTEKRVAGVARVGDHVAYTDMANPRREYVVESGPTEWGQYELIPVDPVIVETTPKQIGLVEKRVWSDLRQYGWTFVRESDRRFHERIAQRGVTDPEGALAELDARYHDDLPEGQNCRLCGIEHAAINPS